MATPLEELSLRIQTLENEKTAWVTRMQIRENEKAAVDSKFTDAATRILGLEADIRDVRKSIVED